MCAEGNSDSASGGDGGGPVERILMPIADMSPYKYLVGQEVQAVSVGVSLSLVPCARLNYLVIVGGRDTRDRRLNSHLARAIMAALGRQHVVWIRSESGHDGKSRTALVNSSLLYLLPRPTRATAHPCLYLPHAHTTLSSELPPSPSPPSLFTPLTRQVTRNHDQG